MGRASKVKPGTVVYNGWVYAQTCGHELTLGQRVSRGLCPVCYEWARATGHLEEHPRVANRTPVEYVIEDVEVGALRTLDEVANAYGKKPASVVRALQRVHRHDLVDKLRRGGR